MILPHRKSIYLLPAHLSSASPSILCQPLYLCQPQALTRRRERMYKSRLHTWGLDKKKKEHEMLEVVRMGLQRRDGHGEANPVFNVRGRQVSLGDALHYFNRKGVKDPQSLLDQQPESSVGSSSPSDIDVRTPVAEAEVVVADDPEDELGLEVVQQDRQRKFTPPPLNLRDDGRLTRFLYAESQLESLQRSLGVTRLSPFALLEELSIPQALVSPLEFRYMEAMLTQTQDHYRSIFATRNLRVGDSAVDNANWTATSDDALADQFYYGMYHGYSFLWNGQRDKAFENFHQSFELIQRLLRDRHVGFLIYIYDLIIRYSSGQEEPLVHLLDFMAKMALTVFGSENHPIRLIALWMKQATAIRSALAEFTLRRMLDFFQDSIGYFHPETVALLQTFAFGLMNRERYQEASMRFQQLVKAFQTTHGPNSYEVCYALRSTADAYFHQHLYPESLQALRAALDSSKQLEHGDEEKEIYVRCLRGMAEISKKLGRLDEAQSTMQHVVDTCAEAFGPDHTFTRRAQMHLDSLASDDTDGSSSIPPMIYRLGRGGRAAKYVWTPDEARLPLKA
jgi:tetratricopeptide (TPR) repeat protein